jgi:sigma-54 specific flagellar transcriptional regulator A
VVVISDSEEKSRDISTVLRFIGESPTQYSYADWQAEHRAGTLESDDIGMIFCSLLHPEDTLVACISDIIAAIGDVPIVFIGADTELPEQSDEKLKRALIASFVELPKYRDLNDVIYRAQCFNEAVESVKNSNNRRPIHLFRSLVGTSRAIQGVRNLMSQVADKEVTVLIEGESGSGKEVVARNLHYHSERRNGPFVPVNCGAIPSELLESELFGHEKGAFTGAVTARAGRFELAEGGTLFLDEIGDMPLHMQVKILRVLQEKSYERVGGTKTCNTNVRIIAATHRNLEKMIEEGKFREDLYYRLNVFPIEMPSLRERSEDTPLLVNEIVKRLESENRGSVRFSSSAILSLCQHPWPGNIRELANLVERMAIIRPYTVVGVRDLPEKYRHVEDDSETFEVDTTADRSEPTLVGIGDTLLLPESGIDLKEYISELEQNLIQQALDNNSGVVARAADQLMIRRTTLVEKMRKYGMQR